MYHEKRSKGRMVSWKEALFHFPAINEELWERANSLFKVQMTRSWFNRIMKVDGPLGKQSFPNALELVPHLDDSTDPVGEKALHHGPWLISKHADRILFLVTHRCHLYCRYCFRRNHEGATDPTREEIDKAILYINSNGFAECILSGGDPLTLSDKRLSGLIQRIETPLIRIHSRAPITAPFRITEALCDTLSTRSGLWVIVHCNHPKELNSEVIDALGRLRKAGIPLLNQSVLLAGVNDDVDILLDLCQQLTTLGVYPYYLHHTDPAAGNQAFRVEIQRGLSIYRQLQKRLSGIALPRYVIDQPDGSGKIDVSVYLGECHGG